MVKHSLDTNILIWFLEGSSDLSLPARQAIESVNAINYVSIVSLWEMAVKICVGKLELKMPFAQITSQLSANGFQILPITFEDTLIISTLTLHHKDPFDRIIIAQAITNDLTVLTADHSFLFYPVNLIK